MYSQSARYGGYRRDCSGFVSMAWRLPTSYTTRSFSSAAHRISISKLIPGDAVWTPGHLTLFVKWISKGRTFLAVEEYNWGHPASYRKRNITGSSRAYRNPKLVTDAETLRRQQQIRQDVEIYEISQMATKTEERQLREQMEIFGSDKVIDGNAFVIAPEVAAGLLIVPSEQQTSNSALFDLTKSGN